MLPELGHDAVQVYAALVKGTQLSDDRLREETGLSARTLDAELAKLLELRLVSRGEGSWSAMDPRAAAGELLDAVDRELRHSQKVVEAGLQRTRAVRRTLADLRPLFDEGRRRRDRGRGVEVLEGRAAVDTALLSAVYEARDEVLTVRPGPSSESGEGTPTEASVRHDLAALGRGLKLRGLYQHSARASLVLRSHAGRVTELGGEIRTVRELHGDITVCDSEVAFLPDAGSPGDTVVVRDAAVVRQLRGLFEAMWQTASPVCAEELGYGGTIDEVHRAVAQLLAEGLKDESAARRLGVSVRSFRRHVAGLSTSLRATSRFQTGAAAARAGLLHDTPGQ